jgi:hypothetical protein
VIDRTLERREDVRAAIGHGHDIAVAEPA